MKEYTITVNGKPYHINIKKIQTDTAIVDVDGEEFTVGVDRKVVRQNVAPLDVKPVKAVTPEPSMPSAATGGIDDVVAPLPGLILTILVKKGEKVKAGQTVMKMEAMKMENEIQANKDGVVSEIYVNEGDAVLESAPLVKIGD